MRFKSVGECIYCGDHSDKLSDEHIIAYGLGGEDVLPHASCKSCQNITSKFELEVLRRELLQVRTKLELPSRKSSLPKELPITVKLGDEAKTFNLPRQKHPTLLNCLLYPPPGVLGGNTPEKGINIIGAQLCQIGGPSLKETLRDLGSNTIEFGQSSLGNEFEKMLAKIALGYAVAEYGINAVRSSPLKSIITGKTENVGHWIGSGVFRPVYGKKFHRVILQKTGNWLFTRIYLFAGMPEYIAIVLEGDSKTKPSILYGDNSILNSVSP